MVGDELMTKEEERKKIVEAVISSEPLSEEEIKENLEDAGFEFKKPAEENKSKKKANL